MSNPKRQHYLPQFYLKGFSDDEKSILVFDRLKDNYFHQTIRKAAAINDYYSLINEPEDRKYLVEKALSKIEGIAAQIIPDVERGANLSPLGKEALALFCTIQMMRVPRFQNWHDIELRRSLRAQRDELRTNHGKAKEILESSGEKITHEDVNNAIAALMAHTGDFEFGREESLKTMVESAPELSRLLLGFSWHFVSRPRPPYLVVSDFPFMSLPVAEFPEYLNTCISPTGQIILMPLTKQTCLIMARGKIEMNKPTISAHQALLINQCSIAFSKRYTFSSCKNTIMAAAKALEEGTK